MSLSKKQWMFLAALAGLCVWGFLLYSNTLHAPFQFDDEKFILTNPAVRQLGDPTLWQDLGHRKRFIAFFSFALNYSVHGNDVAGYHAVNIAIHLLTALFVTWFFLLLLRTPRLREEKIAQHSHGIALLTGLLFVSHPIQTEAVTYISQRFECLAALFYMLSLCFYLKGRMSPESPLKSAAFFMLFAVAAILGALSKEIVFTIPASLILIEWIFLKRPAGGSSLKESEPFWKKPWIYVGSFFLLMLLIFFFLSIDLRRVFVEHAKMDIPSSTYFLTQCYVVLRYMGLLLLPIRQNIDHDVAWSPGLLDGSTLVSALTLLAILWLTFRSIRRFPLIGFGILWFFLTLSVTSSFVPVRDAMFEHRLYLPAVGFLIALCAFLHDRIKNFRIFLLGMVGIILVFSWLTYQRNGVWADALRFWQDAVSKSPGKSRPYTNLGVVYQRRGEYQKAIEAYQMALKLTREPGESLAQLYTNLGAVCGQVHNYQDGIYFCHKAIGMDPRNYQAYSNLGSLYALVGDYENALNYGRKALDIAPEFEKGWNNLGLTEGRMGRYEEAAVKFQRALSLNPSYEEAAVNLRLARDQMKEQ